MKIENTSIIQRGIKTAGEKRYGSTKPGSFDRTGTPPDDLIDVRPGYRRGEPPVTAYWQPPIHAIVKEQRVDNALRQNFEKALQLNITILQDSPREFLDKFHQLIASEALSASLYESTKKGESFEQWNQKVISLFIPKNTSFGSEDAQKTIKNIRESTVARELLTELSKAGRSRDKQDKPPYDIDSESDQSIFFKFKTVFPHIFDSYHKEEGNHERLRKELDERYDSYEDHVLRGLNNTTQKHLNIYIQSLKLRTDRGYEEIIENNTGESAYGRGKNDSWREKRANEIISQQLQTTAIWEALNKELQEETSSKTIDATLYAAWLGQVADLARGWAKRPTKFSVDEQDYILKEKTSEFIFIRKLIKQYHDSLADIQSAGKSVEGTVKRPSTNFSPENNPSESMELLEQLVNFLPNTLSRLNVIGNFQEVQY